MNEQDIAYDTFFTLSLDGGKTHVPFHDGESYAAALGSVRQSRTVTLFRRVHDEEYGVTLSRMLSVDSLLQWRHVVRRILVERDWIYMNGDCWHFAMAARRVSGLDMVAAKFTDEDGVTHVDHVGLGLPDGTFLDVRGIHDSEQSFTTMAPHRPRTVTPIIEDEIHAILAAYGEGDYDPHCSSAREFDRETEALVRLAFGEILEPAPEPAMAP